MSWLYKIRSALTRLFAGRNGVDSLCFASVILALALNLLASFTGIYLLSLLSTAIYVWAIFRMFSRNLAKRREENRRFVEWYAGAKRGVQQFIARVKNIRKYKYVKCPGCAARIRMPRGIGEKTVTCPKCGNSFRQKA